MGSKQQILWEGSGESRIDSEGSFVGDRLSVSGRMCTVCVCGGGLRGACVCVSVSVNVRGTGTDNRSNRIKICRQRGGDSKIVEVCCTCTCPSPVSKYVDVLEVLWQSNEMAVTWIRYLSPQFNMVI